MTEIPANQVVTPARKIADPQPSNSEDRTARPSRPAGTSFARPLVISVLYLGGFVTGFSPIVGVILAHLWHSDGSAPEWEDTHFVYLITTFWVGILIHVLMLVVFFGAFSATVADDSYSRAGGEPPIAFILAILGIVLFWGVAALWFCIRSVISIAKASSAKPITRPRTWLF
ncbi:MAG: hypothetical protein AAF697_03670 [Pseudomonadota bacterium]